MFGIERDLFQVKRKTDKTPEEIKLSAHQDKRKQTGVSCGKVHNTTNKEKRNEELTR